MSRGNVADKLRALARHPLAPTLLTFLLVTVIGTFVSMYIEHRQKQKEAVDARKQAVHALARDIYARRARAEMLLSALRRGASIEEVKERKKLYDEEFVRWSTNHQANLFLIREVLQSSDYSKFESLLEFSLVGNILKPLDECLTAAYDERMNDRDPVPVIEERQCNEFLRKALNCGYALTSGLYELSSSSDGSIDESDYRGIEAKCQ